MQGRIPRLTVCFASADPVVFDAGSKGQATTIIYEFSEFGNIGKFDPMRQQYGQLVRFLLLTLVQNLRLQLRRYPAWPV